MKNRICLWAMAAVCVALAAWLALSAVAIYREGAVRAAEDATQSVFTPEAVKARLAPIVPLFIAGAGLLAAGIALGARDERAEGPVKGMEAGRDRAVYSPIAGKRRGAIQAVLVIAAALLIVAGVFNHGARDVLYKAISICTECIGLG